jgi:hypothetical protein
LTGAEAVSLSASVATIIAAAAVVVTAAIYWRQLKAMTKARETESILAIMSYADNRELRQARYLMLEHSKAFQDLFSVPFSWESRRAIDDRLKQLSAGEVTVDSIDLSLNALNNVCFLIRYGYAPREAPDALLKNSLLHSWGAFAQYVAYRRTRHGTFEGPSRYAEHFEWIVTKKYGGLLNSAV